MPRFLDDGGRGQEITTAIDIISTEGLPEKEAETVVGAQFCLI
jgi:hypothetical protein